MTSTQDITTTAGERFTGDDSDILAALVLKRFGWDTGAAAIAWRRLLLNNCTDAQFSELAARGTSRVRHHCDTCEW